jgi:hypothetical protein
MAAVDPNKPVDAWFLGFLHDIHFFNIGRAMDWLRLDSDSGWHPGAAGGA